MCTILLQYFGGLVLFSSLFLHRACKLSARTVSTKENTEDAGYGAGNRLVGGGGVWALVGVGGGLHKNSFPT
jgi:hypothetical protein